MVALQGAVGVRRPTLKAHHRALTLIFFHWFFFFFCLFFSWARDFAEEEELLVAYGCQNDWTGVKISHIENL